MRKADFQARIKKIEIVNKVLADGWDQAIRVYLDDIELTDDNLLEVRQFKPNEQVNVIIEATQLSLFDNQTSYRGGARNGSLKRHENQELIQNDVEEAGEFITLSEDDGDDPPPENIVRQFKI